ncbi:hypothetical protein DAQ1742_01836 [Dickeya aquatica]|uniref:Uncharacterized protein n=1 Tax=Dickeya aquatica TaxID=1401087 RepID=A0A375A9P9_9GAMM|nr:hypothetical protein DAQ1742_01836 [Dickeya aquatica]
MKRFMLFSAIKMKKILRVMKKTKLITKTVRIKSSVRMSA